MPNIKPGMQMGGSRIMTKRIPLTRGQFAIVDDDDFELLSRNKWCCTLIHKNLYVMRREMGKIIYMHRVIMNPLPGMVVDHIDGNSLNNTRSNLRICLQRDNAKNVSTQSNNTSGYKGVHWRRDRKTWKVEICANGKRVYIGSFHDLQSAVLAYNDAALKYHGEFARLNEIPERASCNHTATLTTTSGFKGRQTNPTANPTN